MNTNAEKHSRADFLAAILNAYPAPAMVLNSRREVVRINTAGAAMYGHGPDAVFRNRTGQVIHCMHVLEGQASCGETSHCPGCVIADSISKSLEGQHVVRARTRMRVEEAGALQEIHLRVTTSPFDSDGERYILLILEDMTELTELKSLLPICANCKRIRNDNQYWQHVEEYFARHLDLEFSHGICPDCVRILYPTLDLQSAPEGGS